MARAKRHYVPDQIWHITQRCHKREFLLKFKQDRHRWIQWLFEAKKGFGLVAGRTAQEYNRRKHRKGAFWEDRYHSTAIETGEQLLRCLVYPIVA